MPYPPAPVRNATLGKKSGGTGIPIAKYIYFHDVATTQFVGFFPPQILCWVRKKKKKEENTLMC